MLYEVYKETAVRITVLNVRIERSLWRSDVLTSNMNLNILNWAILPLPTSSQHKKSKLLWDYFHLKVKSQKGGRPAGRLGMFFLSPKDESRRPGAARVPALFPGSLILPRRPLSSGGGKMRDPGNEVARVQPCDVTALSFS